MHNLITTKVKRMLINHLAEIIRDSGLDVCLAFGPSYSIDLYISYLRGQVVVRVQVKESNANAWIVISDGALRSKTKRRMKAELIFVDKPVNAAVGQYSSDFKPVDSQKFLKKVDQVRDLLEWRYNRECMGVTEMTKAQLNDLRKLRA